MSKSKKPESLSAVLTREVMELERKTWKLEARIRELEATIESATKALKGE
tara:strand:+ start:3216 stop:3365 length:150 start_codon:yes stop_codon:yes gene_type:complete